MLDRQELRRARKREAADLAVDKRLHVAHRPKVAKLVVVDRKLKHILNEDHDLHHREGIDAEILDEPEVVVGILELGPEVRFDKSLNHADHNGRHMVGIPGLSELDGGFESRRGAAL